MRSTSMILALALAAILVPAPVAQAAPGPDVAIEVTPAEPVFRAEQHHTIRIDVASKPGGGSLEGPVQVQFGRGRGYDILSGQGDGWSCQVAWKYLTSSAICDRTGPDALAPGCSFPPLTITMDVFGDDGAAQTWAAAEVGRPVPESDLDLDPRYAGKEVTIHITYPPAR